MTKKTVTMRIDHKFIEWLDIRAKAERLSRTALIEKIGWSYLRENLQRDQKQLEKINQLLA